MILTNPGWSWMATLDRIFLSHMENTLVLSVIENWLQTSILKLSIPPSHFWDRSLITEHLSLHISISYSGHLEPQSQLQRESANVPVCVKMLIRTGNISSMSIIGPSTVSRPAIGQTPHHAQIQWSLGKPQYFKNCPVLVISNLLSRLNNFDFTKNATFTRVETVLLWVIFNL